MAQKVREALSAALEKHNTIVADLSDTTDLDLTFLQLLISARKTSEALGKTFLIKMPANGVVSSKAECAAMPLNQMHAAGAVK
jgi:hypothetical protein